jgi:hypothetical protein
MIATWNPWLTFFPLSTTFIIWEILNFACVVFSCILITKYILPDRLTKNNLTPFNLSIIMLSSYAFIEGFLYGQNHGITLLLLTGIVVAMIKEKWILASILGSISIYKPQFAVGFLICWLGWRCFKTLLCFGLLVLIWQIPVLLTYGISPYYNYIKLTKILMYLPYAEEGYTIHYITPYAMVATWLPIELADKFIVIFYILCLCLTITFAIVAWKSQYMLAKKRFFILAMALLYPLVISPHVLVYDSLILVSIFALLTVYLEMQNAAKLFSIFSYMGIIILIVIGYLLKISLLGVIPLSLFVFMLSVILSSPQMLESTAS